MALEAPWLKQAAWLVVGRIPGGKEPHHSRFAALPRQKQPLPFRHDARVAIGRIRPSKSASSAPLDPVSAFARFGLASNDARCTLDLSGFLAMPGATIGSVAAMFPRHAARYFSTQRIMSRHYRSRVGIARRTRDLRQAGGARGIRTFGTGAISASLAAGPASPVVDTARSHQRRK